jgi:hypothetical protein
MNAQNSPAVEGPIDRPVRPLEIAKALRAYQQGDADGVMVLVSRQACDEGADWLERLERECEVRYHEREQARARNDRAVKILSGIFALLHPPEMASGDGRVFRFVAPNANELLQELANRIRAIPDELDAAGIERPNA